MGERHTPGIHFKESSVSRWVDETVPLLKGKGQEMEGSPPWERNRPWFNQFGEAAKAKERSRHLHKNFGSTGLF